MNKKNGDGMRITWLGHACFLFEYNGYRLITDPYAGVEGYPDLRAAAHQVVCSHGHHDHSAAEQVTLLPARGPSPFSIREIAAFHDRQGGALRGPNTIRVFTAGGRSAVHLGDLGHPLSQEQLSAIGSADAVLVPVGGFYTIGAKEAKQVCDAIGAPCVIPMHYRHPPYGLPAVGGVEEFLALWPDFRRLDGPSVLLDGSASGVLVPKFCGNTAMDD